jgi:flavin reductase (DIM6/NTAB) family NADH-FMN oxidoreductase RutF
MGKITMGPRPLLCPMPAVLVGAKVNGQPNFITVAWCGIANGEPPMIAVAIRHQRYTHRGLRQNMAFSVNVPSTDMVKETDYCGLTSGADVNKAEVCRFKVFYGKLGDVPLIEQCPINLECRVMHILNLGTHSLFVGKIEETHVSQDCLVDGRPDVAKIKPLAFTTAPVLQYHAFGELLGKAYEIGKELMSP